MSARLLVLDDDPAVRLFLDKILSRAGYEVVCVERGAEALEQLRASRFDGFIVDKNLPGENGLDVLVEAHALDPALPAILITAYPEPIFRLGIRLRAYLGKPFESIGKVIETVKKNVEPRPPVDLPLRADQPAEERERKDEREAARPAVDFSASK